MHKEKASYTRRYGLKKAWIKYYGELPPKGLEIHHKDGNPYNNDIDNLEALTHAEHRAKHKTNPCSKAKAIRKMFERKAYDVELWVNDQTLTKLERERKHHIQDLKSYEE